MRYIRTTNDYVEFVETDASEKIISTRGFKFGVLYFQVKNGKVTFYLNDQENPWRNDIWSINIPFSIDGIDCTTEEEAVAELQRIMQIDKTVIATVEWEDYYTKEESDERYELKGSGATNPVDEELDINSKNAVTNSAITIAINSKLDASAYTPTDLSNYDTKDEVNAKIESATSGKVDTSAFNSYSASVETELDSKLDATAYTPTDLSDYYKKSETSGATDISNALNEKQDKSGMTNYSTTIEMNAAINAATSGKADIDDIPSVDGYFDGASYDSQTKRINFKHNNEILAYIDATDFIKDGMVSSVEIRNGKLVITFNSDAGKEAIELNISDIFNADNYYTKEEVNAELAKKADTAVTYTKTEVNGLLDNKLNTSAFNTYSAETKTVIDGKLDASAYTPTDLSNYYTKSETSGATEISNALSEKQDTLIAGDNITISGNVISATQVQSDWNENNSGSTAYIKNRTHYEYEGYSELVNSTVVLNQNGPTHGGYTFSNVNITEGKTYKVVIDEDEYIVTASTWRGGVGLNIPSDASSPFTDTWSIYYTNGSWTISINNAIGETKTIKLYEVGTIVVPLENKYLGLPISGNTDNRNIIANYFNSSISNNCYGCFAEGSNNTISGNSNYSHAEGYNNTIISGSSYSHAEGNGNTISGNSYHSHVEGDNNTISSGSQYSHTEGGYNTINDNSSYSHAEGLYNVISDNSNHSHAEGQSNRISNYSYNSHAEGYDNTINGSQYSHVEGYNNTISDNSSYSHAEGQSNTISGNSNHSHVEGDNNIISGPQYSHAEGQNNTISGYSSYSHAEGVNNTISSNSTCSHAEGSNNTISDNSGCSHVEGLKNEVNNSYEHASGFYNISSKASTEFGNSGNTLFSVGNGSSRQRHNAIEIRQSGDIYVTNTNASGEYYAKPMIKLQDYTQFKIVQLTQAQYDALSTKDNSTLYVIVN